MCYPTKINVSSFSVYHECKHPHPIIYHSVFPRLRRGAIPRPTTWEGTWEFMSIVTEEENTGTSINVPLYQYNAQYNCNIIVQYNTIRSSVLRRASKVGKECWLKTNQLNEKNVSPIESQFID